MKQLLLLIIILLLPGQLYGQEGATYNSTIDYIQKTGRLWGISEVRLNGDRSITLVDADTGYGYALMMSLSEPVRSMTLHEGESCSLSDGHHAFITYEYKKSEDGIISIVVTDRFDARSFGGKITTETATVSITPYRKE